MENQGLASGGFVSAASVEKQLAAPNVMGEILDAILKEYPDISAVHTVHGEVHITVPLSTIGPAELADDVRKKLEQHCSVRRMP